MYKSPADGVVVGKSVNPVCSIGDRLAPFRVASLDRQLATPQCGLHCDLLADMIFLAGMTTLGHKLCECIDLKVSQCTVSPVSRKCSILHLGVPGDEFAKIQSDGHR